MVKWELNGSAACLAAMVGLLCMNTALFCWALCAREAYLLHRWAGAAQVALGGRSHNPHFAFDTMLKTARFALCAFAARGSTGLKLHTFAFSFTPRSRGTHLCSIFFSRHVFAASVCLSAHLYSFKRLAAHQVSAVTSDPWRCIMLSGT